MRGSRRSMVLSLRPALLAVLGVSLHAPFASAQTTGGSTDTAPAPAAPAAPPSGGGATTGGTSPGGGTRGSTDVGGGGRVGPVTSGPSGTTVYTPYGVPAPGTKLDAHLPSSSRSSTDTSRSTDGFDLNQSDGGQTSVRGNPGAAGIFEQHAARVPGTHVVRRGDTLWEITGYYYKNPWMWPKVWSYNPQVQNPHWIYPGDHLKLRTDGGDDRGSQTLGSGVINRRQNIPSDTIFLRDEGYIDDERRDVWGQISGSPEDRMILSDGQVVYIEIEKDHEPKPDQELTIFRPIRGADGTKGTIVQILGTVRIEKYDEKKRLARAKIVESIDAIERGARVGPVGRRFDVVPPQRNQNDVTAHVIVSVWPRVFHAQNQVVFIDKGADDGLAAGNRLFILRRGDPWRAALRGTADLADKRVKPTAEMGPQTESARGTARDADYPDEVFGELRVLRVREKTAACLVTVSRREITSGDLAIARKGY
jgi:hypothetical protein